MNSHLHVWFYSRGERFHPHPHICSTKKSNLNVTSLTNPSLNNDQFSHEKMLNLLNKIKQNFLCYLIILKVLK